MKQSLMHVKSRLVYASNLLMQYLLRLGETSVSILLLLLLPLLLTACATPSTLTAIACPVPPPPPLLSQSMPSQPYSEIAAQNIKEWQKKLIDTQPTPK